MKSNLGSLFSLVRLRLRVILGKLWNLAGVPGLVRDCDYHAGVTDAHVQVRVRELFTIVQVNQAGLRVLQEQKECS